MLTSVKNFIFKLMTPEQRFSRIYRRHVWTFNGSVSGPGSELVSTEALRSALVSVINNLSIRSVIDIPCGDFNWMRELMEKVSVDYTGIDIVAKLIAENERRYSRENIRFECGDLMNGPLPMADLVITRDCFIHLSYKDTFRAMTTIKQSGSTFFLASNYPDVKQNEDIVTGRFRYNNLAIAPYFFPEPEMRIVEDELGKEMWLWKVADL